MIKNCANAVFCKNYCTQKVIFLKNMLDAILFNKHLRFIVDYNGSMSTRHLHHQTPFRGYPRIFGDTKPCTHEVADRIEPSSLINKIH